MKELDNILVDTSVWIDFFRKKEPYYSNVLKLIDDDRISCLGIILAELIQRACSREEIKSLKDFTSVFLFLEESPQLWAKAGELSFSLKKSGYSVGLSDCYIAVVANQYKTCIYTLDHHFAILKEKLDILLF